MDRRMPVGRSLKLGADRFCGGCRGRGTVVFETGCACLQCTENFQVIHYEETQEYKPHLVRASLVCTAARHRATSCKAPKAPSVACVVGWRTGSGR